MKTAVPVYTDLVLTNAGEKQAHVVRVDLQSYNADHLHLQLKLVNGSTSPRQGGEFFVHVAFGQFDFSGQLEEVPGIFSTSSQIFTAPMQAGAGKVKVYALGTAEIQARYMYVWLDRDDLRPGCENTTVTASLVATILQPAEPSGGGGGGGGGSTVTGTLVTSSGFVRSLVLKQGAGTLYNLYGFNNKSSDQFVLLFDATQVPATGAQPIAMLAVGTQDNFGLDIPVTGIPFTTGLVACNSTSAITLQPGALDCTMFATVA